MGSGRLKRQAAWLLPMLAVPLQPAAAALPEVAPKSMEMDAAQLRRIDTVVERGIYRGDYPGAVILIGRRGNIVFHRAYGDRTRVPRRQPMTVDTVFDIASLTKPVATAPAVMQLEEAGRLGLADRVGDLIPACNSAGRRRITVRNLLAHDSGLRAIFTEPLLRQIGSYDDGVRLACIEEMSSEPGETLRYSDLNYILLGEIVRRVSGESLDAYAYRRILRPLGMRDTFFNPPSELHARMAGDDVLTGQVENGVASRMGGVAGHSGLYSTASDLAVYCAMLLNGGVWQGERILSSESIRRMTSSAARHARGRRGLGFDIATGFSGSRGDLFPCDSFGHTGYSGVSMWLDPHSQTFVIILTNRLHPDGKGDVRELRMNVATIAAASLLDAAYAQPVRAPVHPAKRCRG